LRVALAGEIIAASIDLGSHPGKWRR